MNSFVICYWYNKKQFKAHSSKKNIYKSEKICWKEQDICYYWINSCYKYGEHLQYLCFYFFVIIHIIWLFMQFIHFQFTIICRLSALSTSTKSGHNNRIAPSASGKLSLLPLLSKYISVIAKDHTVFTNIRHIWKNKCFQINSFHSSTYLS